MDASVLPSSIFEKLENEPPHDSVGVVFSLANRSGGRCAQTLGVTTLGECAGQVIYCV